MRTQAIMKRTDSGTVDKQTMRATTIDRSLEGCDDASQITRRGFCNGLLLTSAALMATAKGANSLVAEPGAGLERSPMKIDGAESLMPDSSLLFAYPTRNDPAILLRTADGHYYAYSQKCSHLGCSVRFDRDLRRLQCPCHHGAYDAKNGSVLSGPPKRPLDQIFLQTRGGEVWAVGRRSDSEPLIAAAN